jgi:hypothetical protein
MLRAAVRLGGAQAVIAYPRALCGWFDHLPNVVGQVSAQRFSLVPGAESDRFKVLADDEASAPDLSLGDALAKLWEQVAFCLVTGLDDALALHAAALSHETGEVLLPGQSGAGKTHLALWYRTRGYELGTDEIVTISLVAGGLRDAFVTSTLARPVILKEVAHRSMLAKPEEQSSAAGELSATGLIARLKGSGGWTQRHYNPTFIVFPHYVAGASLSLTALTAAQTGFRLLGNCINWRNLASNGLSLVSAVARHALAVDLIYGDTMQLDGCLDVLTRQVLAARPGRDDLAVLCAAFTARAALIQSAPPVPGYEVTTCGTNFGQSAPTGARGPFRLTVGMATYDDYDGVYFTVQAIRTYNPDFEGAIEFVVIDNNPEGRCSKALCDLGKSIEGYRYIPRGDWSGTAVRNVVFEEVSSELVLCVDSHVLIVPGALAKLVAYLEDAPESRDLIQGPLLHDDLCHVSTHMEPTWRDGMYGTWENDARGSDPRADPFEIPMQGLGVFACRRNAWPQFNPAFRGFGGEEGYIHEKSRRRGGRTLCFPALRWLHRFGRPLGPPFQNRWEDRMRNYLIGFTELGLDTSGMENHFADLLGAEVANPVFARVRLEFGLLQVCVT